MTPIKNLVDSDHTYAFRLALTLIVFLLASCGGGSSDTNISKSITPPISASPLGNCLALRVGVKYSVQGYDNATQQEGVVEFVTDSYKGQPAISKVTALKEKWLFAPVGTIVDLVERDFYHMTAVGRERIANLTGGSIRFGDDVSEFSSTSEYQPADVLPANLLPGQAYNWDYYENKTSQNSTNPSTTTTNDHVVGKTEFIGFEDIILDDGTVIKDACKLKTTHPSTAQYALDWVAAGLPDLRHEEYFYEGRLSSTKRITKILIP